MGHEIKLGGKATVCCFHGRNKREFDWVPRRSDDYPYLRECLCCENAFRSNSNEPNQICKHCSPKIIEGAGHIG